MRRRGGCGLCMLLGFSLRGGVLLVRLCFGWSGWWVRTEGIEGAYALAERGALFAEEFFVHRCISGVCGGWWWLLLLLVAVELWREEFGEEDRLRVRRVKNAPLTFSFIFSPGCRGIRVMCCDTSYFFATSDGTINSSRGQFY